MSAGRALGLVSLAAVLANATWFSASAVVPALERQWGLQSSGAAWLVVAVQLGFVVGSVGAALLNLPDRLQPRRLIGCAAIAAAAANADCCWPTGSRVLCRRAFWSGSLWPACTRRV